MHSGETNSHNTGGSSSERYSLIEIIGKGSFGDVYRAIDNKTNKHVAVKIVDLDDLYVILLVIYLQIACLIIDTYYSKQWR